MIGFLSFVSNPTAKQLGLQPHTFLDMSNLPIFWIASIITTVVAFTLVWMFGYKDSDVKGAGAEKKNAFKTQLNKKLPSNNEKEIREKISSFFFLNEIF